MIREKRGFTKGVSFRALRPLVQILPYGTLKGSYEKGLLMSHLPVPFTPKPFRSRREKSHDSQIVKEFRAKLQLAEEMISKLAFSLNEIQGMKRKPSASKKLAKVAKILRVGERD